MPRRYKYAVGKAWRGWLSDDYATQHRISFGLNRDRSLTHVASASVASLVV